MFPGIRYIFRQLETCMTEWDSNYNSTEDNWRHSEIFYIIVYTLKFLSDGLQHITSILCSNNVSASMLLLVHTVGLLKLCVHIDASCVDRIAFRRVSGLWYESLLALLNFIKRSITLNESQCHMFLCVGSINKRSIIILKQLISYHINNRFISHLELCSEGYIFQ